MDSRAVIPNAEIAVKLAEALDTSVEYLVKGTGAQPRPQPDIPKKEAGNYEKYKRIVADLPFSVAAAGFCLVCCKSSIADNADFVIKLVV